MVGSEAGYFLCVTRQAALKEDFTELSSGGKRTARRLSREFTDKLTAPLSEVAEEIKPRAVDEDVSGEYLAAALKVIQPNFVAYASLDPEQAELTRI